MSAAWTKIKPLAGSAIGGVALGVSLYAVTELAGDMSTFFLLRTKALALSNDNQELKDRLGHPFSVGFWYNSRIGFTHRGHMCQCTFPLLGTHEMTDVTVRAVRKKCVWGNAFYNFLGSADWTLLVCDAMFPAGGAMAEPRSLLSPPPPPPADSSSGCKA